MTYDFALRLLFVGNGAVFFFFQADYCFKSFLAAKATKTKTVWLILQFVYTALTIYLTHRVLILLPLLVS